ncbi:MAG: hypothetical protein R2710_15110 [Acidimicrobiales bacterium]
MPDHRPGMDAVVPRRRRVVCGGCPGVARSNRERELGIPCAVSVGGALSRLADGMVIEIDGGPAP